jgi:CubicO group peptidase (beta-lactamase class C family)
MAALEVVPLAPDAAVNFVPDRIFDLNSYHSGGAGMAGTASDFMLFLEALRTGGGAILKPETVAMASRNQIGAVPRREVDAGWRFGFLSGVLDDAAAANTPQSKGTLQWGGIYGHKWFIDRSRDLSVVVFTNTAPSGDRVFALGIRDAIYGRS